MSIALKLEGSSAGSMAVSLSPTSVNAKKDRVAILSEVFAGQASLSMDIREIIFEYLSQKERSLINRMFGALDPKSPFVPHLNLSDPDILQFYLGREFQDKRHLDKAIEIITRVYKRARVIDDPRYGMALSVNPEVLAYAMKLAQNKNVLEIASASGENAILLAFAGAKRVYVNDIVRSELATFQGLKDQLPPEVGAVLEPIEGDCADLLRKKPEMKKQIDLILCRNLIHFFTDRKQDELFKLVKQMLREDGRAIFMVNSIYTSASKAFKKHPLSTSFISTNCFVTDYALSRLPCATIFEEMSPCSDTKISTLYTDHYLSERKLGREWVVDKDAFGKLDPAVKDKIEKAFYDANNQKNIILPITKGSVRALITTTRCYSTITLPALFKTHGFIVETTFLVEREGHLAHSSKNAYQMGVVVRYEGALRELQ